VRTDRKDAVLRTGGWESRGEAEDRGRIEEKEGCQVSLRGGKSENGGMGSQHRRQTRKIGKKKTERGAKERGKKTLLREDRRGGEGGESRIRASSSNFETINALTGKGRGDWLRKMGVEEGEAEGIKPLS